jgi:hypothetical protein
MLRATIDYRVWNRVSLRAGGDDLISHHPGPGSAARRAARQRPAQHHHRLGARSLRRQQARWVRLSRPHPPLGSGRAQYRHRPHRRRRLLLLRRGAAALAADGPCRCAAAALPLADVGWHVAAHRQPGAEPVRQQVRSTSPTAFWACGPGSRACSSSAATWRCPAAACWPAPRRHVAPGGDGGAGRPARPPGSPPPTTGHWITSVHALFMSLQLAAMVLAGASGRALPGGRPPAQIAIGARPAPAQPAAAGTPHRTQRWWWRPPCSWVAWPPAARPCS